MFSETALLQLPFQEFDLAREEFIHLFRGDDGDRGGMEILQAFLEPVGADGLQEGVPEEFGRLLRGGGHSGHADRAQGAEILQLGI